MVFPQRYSFPRINTLRLYTYHAPVKMLFLSYGAKYWAECCNSAFNLWPFGCQISELHHLILLDIWAKMYCNYRMNSWPLTFGKHTGISSSLSHTWHMHQIWRNPLKVLLRYRVNMNGMVRGTDGQPEDIKVWKNKNIETQTPLFFLFPHIWPIPTWTKHFLKDYRFQEVTMGKLWVSDWPSNEHLSEANWLHYSEQLAGDLPHNTTCHSLLDQPLGHDQNHHSADRLEQHTLTYKHGGEKHSY